jgi:recombinational DNA repair protein RecR
MVRFSCDNAGKKYAAKIAYLLENRKQPHKKDGIPACVRNWEAILTAQTCCNMYAATRWLP